MRIWAAIAEGLARRGNAVLVTVHASSGSAPREAGAAMAIFADGTFTGTIGGGTLEWRAIAEAQRMLAGGTDGDIAHLSQKGGGDSSRTISVQPSPLPLGGCKATPRDAWLEGRSDRERGSSTKDSLLPLITPSYDRSYALGPELGQCCGGRVTLRFEPVTLADRAAIAERIEQEAREDRRRRLYLFGAGHVGRALVLALAPLPFDVTWVDSRPDAFPAAAPGNVRMIAPTDPVAFFADVPAAAFVLVLTHSHQLDLALVDAAIRRETFPYVGVIGSATKRARFESRLRQAGVPAAEIERLVCPIGAGGPKSKLPAAIAAATAVELLIADEAAASRADSGDVVVAPADRMNAARGMRGHQGGK